VGAGRGPSGGKSGGGSPQDRPPSRGALARSGRRGPALRELYAAEADGLVWYAGETPKPALAGALEALARAEERGLSTEGVVHFVGDIYGHDRVLDEALGRGYPCPE
jgi:hypothetical protein